MKTITQYQTCKEPSTKLLLELALSIVWFSRRLENYMCPNPYTIWFIVYDILLRALCLLDSTATTTSMDDIVFHQYNRHRRSDLMLCSLFSVGGAWRMEPTHRQNTHSTSEIFLEAYSTVRLSTAVL